MKRIAK
jgi:hypothetical protein